jgi:chromosome segregation ATPase
VWEAAVAMEAARAEVVRFVVAYSWEAAAARERADASIKEAEAQTSSIEREAQEMVLKAEQENAASLASIHEEASELTRRVTFIEGELEDARQTQHTAEANFQGLSMVGGCREAVLGCHILKFSFRNVNIFPQETYNFQNNTFILT